MMQAISAPWRALVGAALWIAWAPFLAAQDTDAATLRARLPESQTLVERDGALLWQVSGGPALRILDVSKATARVDVGGRTLAVASSLFGKEGEANLRKLPALVKASDAAALDLESLTYRFAPLLGAHLKSDEALVLDEGVAKREDAPAVDARQRTRALRDAAKEFAPALAASPLSEGGREALRRFVANLHLRDAQVARDSGALPPSAGRQMVRAGWLGGFGIEPRAVRALTDAVLAVEALFPTKRYAGAGGLEVWLLANAAGPAGVQLKSQRRAGYAVDLPTPQFFDRPSGLVAAVQLAPGSDPAGDAEVLAADVYAGDAWVAGYSKAQGFRADAAAWRATLPNSLREGAEDLVPEALPPHVLVRSLAGDVRFLATAHGVLIPPRDGSDVEVTRFLGEASVALPDAGHLDLIGQYLFRYSFDSPDPRYPLLVGDQTLNGEIHQDAAQTLATVAGGIVRGDCDDLAELYLRVLEKQGKHGHLMSLPRHCAVCWSEPVAGGWLSRVLQTGPAMQFTGDVIAKSLVRAYQHFSGGQVVDPNQLGILLRFSGENVRTPYVLGWRIFQDRAYSQVMVDVQRDWHFHTYRHGFEKMKALVAAGDEDNANYRELSGLCQSTGQFGASAEFLGQALTRVREPDAAVNLALERMHDLFEQGDREGARAQAKDILERMLPEAKDAFGEALPNLAQEFAARLLLHEGNTDLALQVLRTHVTEPVDQRLLLCYRYLSGKGFDLNEWATSPVLMQSRDLLSGFVGTMTELLEQGGPALAREAADEVQTIENWLAVIAFRAPIEPSDTLTAYAAAARYWRALLGREAFAKLLAGVEWPKGKPPAEQRRMGFAQLLADLPWISLSIDYWVSELQEQFGRHAKDLDRDRALANAAAVLKARDQAAARKLLQPRQEMFAHLAQLTQALLREDEAALRARLVHVREQNDKFLRDFTTRWLADSARFLSLGWFERVLVAWREEVDFKPSYFGIAWGAVLARAPQHGLLAGKLGAERFADDEAFVAEYAFMQKLLGGK